MARKPDIQYIHQFYVPGSEARVLELKPVKKKNKRFVLPQPQQEKNVPVTFDRASVCGIALACVMMVLLICGMCSLSRAYEEYRRVESCAISLQNENVVLRERYQTEIDLEDIREKAIGLGMVPAQELSTVPITVETVEREAPTPWWEEVRWFLSQLFA